MRLPNTQKIHRAIPSRLRSLARSAAYRGLAPMRTQGLVPRGVMDTDKLLGLHRGYTDVETHLSIAQHGWTDPTIPQSPHRPSLRQARTVFSLIDCRGKHGWRFDLNHLISPDDLIVAETDIPAIDYPASLARFTKTIEHFDGTAVYLSNTWPSNYSHWMLIVMPLLTHYRKYLGSEPDWFYVGEPINSWQREVLAKAGVSISSVVDRPFTADRILSVSPTRYGRAIDRDSLGYVRSLYRTDVEQGSTNRAGSSAPRRIFLARGEATTRRFLNEEDCVRALHGLGFELVSTSGLSLAEEGELFSDAEVIVSCHGSALTNVMFAPPGVLVIELLPLGLEYDAVTLFCELTASVAGRYAAIVGDDLGVDRKAIDLDLHVDPLALRKLVIEALDSADNKSVLPEI